MTKSCERSSKVEFDHFDHDHFDHFDHFDRIYLKQSKIK